MLQSTDIEKLLQQISAKLKGVTVTGKRSNDSDEQYKRAEWGKLYKEAVKHCEEIEVHACGEFPQGLLGHSFPNESAVEMEYRKKTFQPITTPYWKKAIRGLNRIWSEQNYTIKWGDEEEVKEYFTKNMPICDNIFSYFKQVVTTNKINDPNAVLAVDFDMPVRQDEEGNYVADDTTPLKPYPSIYCCDDVLMFVTGKFALLMSEERSMVDFGGKKQAIGYVMYLYDEQCIYRIQQIGKKADWQFECVLYYQHNLGYVPCWKLKGTPEEVINEEVLYDSHYSPAIPHLNKALILDTTLGASITKIAYPIRVYYEQSCTNPDCSGGNVFDESTKGMVKCSSCGGTGKLKFSPFRDYKHEMPTMTSQTGAQDVAFPGITYVAPDSSILEFGKSTITDWIQQAFLFLNVDAAPDGMKAGLGKDATATKSKIDREEQFVSMLDISNELFELLQKFVAAAYQIRYMTDSPLQVNAPKNFELIGSAELTDELGAAKLAGVPDVAMGELTMEYVVQRFSQNGLIPRVTKVAKYCDALFSKDDISISLNKAYLQPWEIVLHIFIYHFIYTEIEVNNEFLDKDMEDIKAALIEKAKVKAEELGMGTVSADKILNDIAGGGNQLANSVGGLTGIIEIVKAVSSGVYDLEAAVALVSSRFGVSEEDARKQLGTPQVINSAAEAQKVQTLTA